VVRHSSSSRSWVLSSCPSDFDFHFHFDSHCFLFFILTIPIFLCTFFFLFCICSELLSKEEPGHFWDFIHAWLHADHSDAQSHSAKSCVNKILQHSRPLLRDPLASLFEFSLILRSASPSLVLYRQLAHDSLSSHSHAEIPKVDALNLGVSLQSPGGMCCWVDTGDTLFFDVSELLLWLQTPQKQ